MPYPWPFFLALAASFVFFFGFQLIVVPLPLFVQSLGGSASHIGLVMGAMAVAAILARPLAGWVADSRGRRLGLLSGSLLFGVGYALYPLSPSVAVLLLPRILQGVGISLFTTAYIAYISDLAPPERRGEAIGIAGLASPASMLVGPLAGASIADGGRFSQLFLLCAGLLLAATALVAILPETLSGSLEKSAQVGFRRVVGSYGILTPVLVTVVTAATYGVLLSFLPVFVLLRRAGNPGLFFTAFAATVLATQVGAGRLSDLVGRRAVGVPGLGLLGGAMALLLWVRSQWLLLAAGVVYGLGYGAVRSAVDALIVEKVKPEDRGAAMGVNYGGFDFGVGIGPLLLGPVADLWGYEPLYLGMALLAWAGAFLFLKT